MKRTIQWIIVALLMGVLLVGCGQGTTKDETEKETTTANEETATNEETAEEDETAANEETTNNEEAVTKEPTSQTEQMTATYVGLIDNNSFQVETEDGKSIAVRFSEQFYDKLESLMGGTMTFAYEVNENGQYELVDIIKVVE